MKDAQQSNTSSSSPKSSLLAHGRMDWSKAHRILSQSEAICFWCDLDGLQHGDPPQDPPLASHLWAQTSGQKPSRFFRLRIDGKDCVVAELIVDGLDSCNTDELVEVVSFRTCVWPRDERRLAKVTLELLPKTLRVHEVQGLCSIQFLEFHA